MTRRAGRRLGQAGALMIATGAFVLLAGSQTAVTAASRGAGVSAPSCGYQPNRNDPTNSTNQALDSYWFQVEHNGTTESVCTLFGNVQAGDIITAHFTVAAGANVEVTLVSNTATSASSQQALFDCASYSSGPDTDSAADPCTTSSSPTLTVNVPADCGFQADLIYGEPLATMTQGAYRDQHRWIDGQVGNRSSATSCPGGPTPTPSPSPSPSASPSPPPQGTPTPTSGVGGISTGTPSTGAGGSDLEMAAGFVVMLLGAGAAGLAIAARRSRRS